MNIALHMRRFLPALAAILGLVGAQSAWAVDLDVVVHQPTQIGATAQVEFGHTIVSFTNYNRITAGGTYRISCNNTNIQPLTGQRSVSKAGFTGGLQMYVTVPETIPTTRSLPGFTSVPKGTDLNCTYEWTARAAEGNYTIGAGGIGIVIGGEERTDGGTEPFKMYREDNDGRGCIQV